MRLIENLVFNFQPMQGDLLYLLGDIQYETRKLEEGIHEKAKMNLAYSAGNPILARSACCITHKLLTIKTTKLNDVHNEGSINYSFDVHGHVLDQYLFRN